MDDGADLLAGALCQGACLVSTLLRPVETSAPRACSMPERHAGELLSLCGKAADGARV